MELKKKIPSVWETKRLTMEDLIKEDIQTVQKLYEQGSFVHQWDGGSIDEKYAYPVLPLGTYLLMEPRINTRFKLSE